MNRIRSSRDYAELLFAASLIELAKIYADPLTDERLKDYENDPFKKADYLKSRLVERMPRFNGFNDMFAFNSEGHLTIAGDIMKDYLNDRAAQISA